MKNKLFSLLLAGIATLTIQAQTDYAKLGIERKVLFTMNKNEICTYVDTRNLQKGVNNIKYSEIFVIDTIREITTYVYNGERICTGLFSPDPGTYGIAYAFWGVDPVHTADMPPRDSLILVYQHKDGSYIRYGNEEYGPYTCVDHISWNKFVFSYDTTWPIQNYYIHDADGMIYAAKGQGRTFFQSPDKKHSAMVASDNIYKIRLDNVSYTLDSIKNGRTYDPIQTANLSVFNDGSCLVEYMGEMRGYGDMGDGWDSYRGKNTHYTVYAIAYGGYYIKDGKVHLLAQNEYFDKNDLTIKVNEEDDDAADNPSSISEDDYWQYDKYGRIDTKYYAELWNKLTRQVRYGYNIWDEKHEHNLFTIPGLGYILVDGIAVKADYPLMACRNTIVNAFRWVVVEGNEVVYYSYQIP